MRLPQAYTAVIFGSLGDGEIEVRNCECSQLEAILSFRAALAASIDGLKVLARTSVKVGGRGTRGAGAARPASTLTGAGADADGGSSARSTAAP